VPKKSEEDRKAEFLVGRNVNRDEKYN